MSMSAVESSSSNQSLSLSDVGIIFALGNEPLKLTAGHSSDEVLSHSVMYQCD